MGEDTIEFSITEDVGRSMSDMDSFFNILNATEFDEPTIVDIACTGKTLVNSVSERVDEACEFIQDILGNIEIIREWSPLPGSGPGRIVGVKFTASKILNEVLKEGGFNKDLGVKIGPVPAPHGERSLLSEAERVWEMVQDGSLGLHGNLNQIREVTGKINEFVNGGFSEMLRLKRKLDTKGEMIAQELMGKESMPANGAHEQLSQASNMS